MKNEDFIKTSLNKILSMRLGIRLLCEHHIALNKQSNLNKMLLPDTDDVDDQNEPHVDQFESKYLTTNGGAGGPGGGSGSGGDSAGRSSSKPNWIGIINKRFSPKKLVENSGKLATRICLDKYGVAPR